MTAATVTTEMSEGLRRLAEPVRAGDSVKALIARAARRSGLAYSRCYECWYGRARVRAEELERVRQLLRAGEREANTDEVAELRARIARLEEMAALANAQRTGLDRAADRQSGR